jgi:glyoxalase family protein
MAVEVGFAVPETSLSFWAERLDGAGVTFAEANRFGETALSFSDPDDLPLALYGVPEAQVARPFSSWADSPVSEEHQLRGLHVARLLVGDGGSSERFLAETYGYAPTGEEAGWKRFAIAGGGSGKILDVRQAADEGRGSYGPGTVHHVAFRVPDDEQQVAVREAVAAAGRSPTPVIDRFWFRSVYFREPGGVLFEVATDGPGFDVDEDPAALGETLILPPWLEPRRAEIEAALPPLDTAG